MKLLKLAYTIALTGLMTGCMTEATQQRFTTEGQNAQACKMKMMDAKVQIQKWKAEQAKAAPKTQPFKDDKMALISIMIQQQGQMNVALLQTFTAKAETVDQCDRIIVAMVKADAAKVAGLNGAGRQAIGWVAGLIGLGIISDNWGPSNYGGGGDGDTWNVSGSRVNSKSGNVSGGGSSSVSSSGEGLGLGNTFSTGSGQSIGGIEPRTTNANGAVTDLNTGSNSGTNEPVDLPEVPETDVPDQGLPE